jgi:hypothetical protein
VFCERLLACNSVSKLHKTCEKAVEHNVTFILHINDIKVTNKYRINTKISTVEDPNKLRFSDSLKT